MKISLRKANALQAVINEAVNALDLTTEVKMNEFEKPSEKIAFAKSRMKQNMHVRSDLLDALYEIRDLVAAANSASGIDGVLAKLARLEKDIVLYNRLAKLEPALANDVLVGKLGKIKGRTEDYYGRDETVASNIFDEADIAEYKAALATYKKNKVAMQDQLLELNVKTEISVTSKTEQTLRDLNLI